MNRIDNKYFEKLCMLQCNIEEICSACGCSEEELKKWCLDTYNKTFEDIYQIKSLWGKTTLRNLQFKLAEKSPTMAIYLGKVYLGQKDNKEVEENDD